MNRKQRIGVGLRHFGIALTMTMTTLTPMTQAMAAAAVERKDIPDKYKWNLADLYPSEAAWTKAKEDAGPAAAGAGQVSRPPGQVAAAAAGGAADDVRPRSRAVAAGGLRQQRCPTRTCGRRARAR